MGKNAERNRNTPFVSLRVRDPSVGEVRPLQEASPLWASRMVGRCCLSDPPPGEAEDPAAEFEAGCGLS